MFAQESVMDIQKEREAFEAWYRKEYDNTVIDDSEFSEILDEYESNYYWVDELNQSWKAWQAAKAQAVQEWINVDDRLPPVDETVLVCWDYAPDIEPEKEYTTIDENLDECWPNCQDEPPTHWMPLPKVVEAQEPTND